MSTKMSNARGLVAKLMKVAGEMRAAAHEQTSGLAGNTMLIYANKIEALAAEGVQAGEVDCDCPGEGKDDPALHAPNCPARLSQQPEARDAVDEALPEFLERMATEIEARDTLPGSFAEGLATSLRGRAYIVRAAITGERNG